MSFLNAKLWEHQDWEYKINAFNVKIKIGGLKNIISSQSQYYVKSDNILLIHYHFTFQYG